MHAQLPTVFGSETHSSNGLTRLNISSRSSDTVAILSLREGGRESGSGIEAAWVSLIWDEVLSTSLGHALPFYQQLHSRAVNQ